LGGLILAAWGLLIALQRSDYAELLGHEVILHNGFPPALRPVFFLSSWSLMTVAMMLPGSLPILSRAVRPFRQRVERNWLAGLTILGYLVPWSLFGLLAYLGDGLLHRMVTAETPLAAYSGMIAPGIVLVAGLYQFTPGKRSFMVRCRPSNTSIQRDGAENLNGAGPFKLGVRLGVSCVGSCWSLMLLMFAVGHNRLDWMLALSGIMASERLAPSHWSRRLAWLVGLALIAWAIVWVLAAPHSGHSHHP
jgi:predicted metal-binding membrane protein